MVRAQAGLSVVRFCALLGMPQANWYRWRAAVTGGAARPGKGPWPAPVVDRIEPLAAKHAETWAAWGYRKVWGCWPLTAWWPAMPGVRRAVARRGLLQPSATRPSAGSSPARAGRCSWTRRPGATACGRPTCSELESLAGGTWRMGGVVDCWAKTCLACPVTATQGTRDAVAALEAAIDQAETLLGVPLLEDCVDHHTGELTPVVVVTDDGPAYRSVGFARFIASRPGRHCCVQTDGVVQALRSGGRSLFRGAGNDAA